MQRTLLMGLVLLLAILNAWAQQPHVRPSGEEKPGLMVRRGEVMKTAPIADLGVARYWAVEKRPDVMSLLVEVDGTIPLHFHPDGIHRMYILEGRLRCTVAEQTMEMGPGDYMLIPRGTSHKFERLGKEKAYFVSVDVPPIDPKNNVWLETAPRRPLAPREEGRE